MLVVMGSVGLALSVALFVGAPVIVRVVLGPEYEPSIMVMRILAVLPLLIAISNIFVIQLMLPFGKDKAVTSIVLSAGLINIVLATLFVPIWKEIGMAAGVSLSETFVTATSLIYLLLRKLNPLGELPAEEKVAKL